MSQASRVEAGRIIAAHRGRREFSQGELARLIGVERSLISLIESGRRSPHSRYLARLIAVLGIEGEDRTDLLRLLGLEHAILDAADLDEERRVGSVVMDAYRRNPLVARLADQPRYLLQWVAGRLAVGRYQAQRAVGQLASAVSLARDLAGDELYSIIILDYADALTLAGALDRSDALVRDRCLPLAARMLGDDPDARRSRMAMARTVVTLVNTAYNRGDEAACWREHDRAIPHLAAAGDEYGWAKSLFFLALFRFWQGRLDEAEALARAITVRRDYWWDLRDVLWLSRTWWIIIALALLIDILACNGACGTEEFDALVLEYREAKPLWVRDFPPFAPRYLWLDGKVADDADAHRATIERWLRATEAGGCWNIHADLQLVYGDFLRWSAPGGAAAQDAAERAYREAGRIAAARGFGLHERSANRRLADAAPPFPGLAR